MLHYWQPESRTTATSTEPSIFCPALLDKYIRLCSISWMNMRTDACGRLSKQDFLAFFGHRGLVRIRLGLCISANRGRPIVDCIEPAFNVWEVVQILLLSLPRYDPGVSSNICNRIVIAHNELPPIEPAIEHVVQAVGFIHVTVDCVGDLLRSVVGEVMILSGHRAETANLPEQPFQCGLPASQIFGQQLPRFLGQIDQDCARLEYRHGIAPVRWGVIDDRGHLIIGADLEKRGLELIPRAYVYRDDPVLESSLFEKYRDLVAVWSGPIVKVDHCGSFFIPRRKNPRRGVRCRHVYRAEVRARGRPDHLARTNG